MGNSKVYRDSIGDNTPSGIWLSAAADDSGPSENRDDKGLARWLALSNTGDAVKVL